MTIEDRIHEALQEYADTIEPEPDSWEQISARVDDGRALRPPSRGRMLVFASLAVMTVVVLAGVLLVRDTSDDPERDQVVTAPRAVAGGMPSRIIAVNTSGQPVLLDAVSGEQEAAYPMNGVAEGVQVAVTPDGQDAYVVRGNGNKGCEDHDLMRVRVGVGDVGFDMPRISTNATDPTVSPDGRYLAYLHCSPESGNRADHIMLLSLTTGEERVTTAPVGTFFLGRLEFAPDSNHVVFNLFDDSTGRETVHELAVVSGEPPPGRDVGLAEGGWAAVRGQTGDYLGIHSTPPRVVIQKGPAPSTTGTWFSLPGVPTQVVSDRSGRHALAVVDGALYRWSEGEQGATKIADGVIGAAWIPDPPEASKPTAAVSEPIGVLVAFGGERMAVLGTPDGQEHSSLGTFQGLTSLSTTPDGRDVYFAVTGTSGACGSEAGPDVVHLVPATEVTERVVGGAGTPVVSPDGKFVAYGITCDGETIGMTNLLSGANYRTDPLAGTPQASEEISSVEVLGWSPNSRRLVYHLVLADDPQPRYYVGRFAPAARLEEAEVTEILNGDGSITAAAFVDDDTVMIARRQGDRNTLHEVALSFLAEATKPKTGPDWDKTSLLTTGGFPAPGQVTSLVSDRSGQHFLVITNDRTLHHWFRGDAQPTRLAGDVTAAAWLPWS
jgi:hypothetical protein